MLQFRLAGPREPQRLSDYYLRGGPRGAPLALCAVRLREGARAVPAGIPIELAAGVAAGGVSEYANWWARLRSGRAAPTCVTCRLLPTCVT